MLFQNQFSVMYIITNQWTGYAWIVSEWNTWCLYTSKEIKQNCAETNIKSQCEKKMDIASVFEDELPSNI